MHRFYRKFTWWPEFKYTWFVGEKQPLMPSCITHEIVNGAPCAPEQFHWNYIIVVHVVLLLLTNTLTQCAQWEWEYKKKNLEKIKGKQMSYCCGVCAWLWCTLPLKNTHFKMKNRLLSICGKHLTSFQCAFKNISHSYASEAQILLFVSRVCLVAAKCNKWGIYKDYGYSVWLKSAFNVHHQQMHLNFLKFKMQWKRKIRKKKRGAMKQNLSD